MKFSRNPVVLCFLVLGFGFIVLSVVDGFISLGEAFQHLLVPYTLPLAPTLGSTGATFLMRVFIGGQVLIILFGLFIANSSKKGWRITWSIPGVLAVFAYMAVVMFAYFAPPEHIG